MLLYVFALFLVYTDGRNIGKPDENTSILGNAILELANHCGNELITEEARKIAKDCNVIVPPYEEKQLKCLMFYDMTMQLCREKPLIEAAAYKAKMTDKVNITTFSRMPVNYNIQNLPEYPEYQSKLDVILKDPFECYKLCSEEDLFSKDVNFYCKYYKWGTELLGIVKTPAVSTVTGASAVSSVDTLKSPLTNTADEQKEKPQSVAATNAAETKKPTPAEAIENKDIEVNPPAVQESSPINTSAVNPAKVEDAVPSNNPAVVIPAIAAVPEEQKPVKNTGVQLEPMPSSNDDAQKVQEEEKPPVKTDDLKKSGDEQDAVLNKPKAGNSDPDYESELDEEEGKDGLSEMNGDDADDGVMNEIKPYPPNDKPAKKTQISVSVLNPEDSEKSIFPNMQESFSDDEDHFFPFFLTIVILVVLLYVLYHNKSKVTKVVLGLIVEGRQSGRGRRGSRGHAYRRLDTLEQAMGATSTAPPSKIIY